jgi:hypothetical protein
VIQRFTVVRWLFLLLCLLEVSTNISVCKVDQGSVFFPAFAEKSPDLASISQISTEFYRFCEEKTFSMAFPSAIGLDI